jgi:hypothetical protein
MHRRPLLARDGFRPTYSGLSRINSATRRA